MSGSTSGGNTSGVHGAKGQLIVGMALGVLAVFFFGFVLMMVAVASIGSGPVGRGAQIGVVEVKGTIAGADPVVDLIQSYTDDAQIEAILIRVDSPGGSVSASQEIVEAIRGIKKPVVISMGDMAASGAYYVSCAGPKIYASAGTLTGSIGVISQIIEYKDVMDFLKLKVHTIKTGELKDSGSPFREFNETDSKYFTELGLEVLDQFVSHVAEARHLDKAKVQQLATGQVWTGRQAKALGLIDEIGGMQAAIDALKKEAHIEGPHQLVYPKKGSDELLMSLLEQGASEVSEHVQSQAREMINRPETFQYLYRP